MTDFFKNPRNTALFITVVVVISVIVLYKKLKPQEDTTTSQTATPKE